MKTIRRFSDSRVMLVMSLLLGTLVISGPTHAEVYKWKDADGNIQYTQHPPPGDTESEILVPSTGTSSSQPLPPPVFEPEKEKPKPDDKLEIRVIENDLSDPVGLLFPNALQRPLNRLTA